MNRKVGMLLLTTILCVALSGCGEAVYVQSEVGSYEVSKARLEETFQELVAPEGSLFLAVQVKDGGANLDNMQNTFFAVEQERVTVTDPAGTYACKSIYYSLSEENEASATMLFEVPVSFAKQFTLAGGEFSPVQLEAKKNTWDSITSFFDDLFNR